MCTKHFVFFSLFVLSLFGFSSATLAAQVGFVPSTGVWFSRTELSPNESVRIYTVIVNNNYYALNGTVAFYDNETSIDTAAFTALKKGEARQLSVFWQPSEGDHKISARFTKAEAVDEKGVKTTISLDSIVATSGQPLSLTNGEVTEVGAAALSVEQKDDRLLLTPQKTASNAVAIATSQKTTSSAVAASEESGGGGENIFEKNKALLGKAESAAQTITSTAEKVENVVASVKSAAAQAGAWYETGKEGARTVWPVVRQIYYGWLVVSNENDPVRIAIIVAVVLLVWFVVRRLRRRHRFYDDL
jgi:hypothetical protein